MLKGVCAKRLASHRDDLRFGEPGSRRRNRIAAAQTRRRVI